MSVIINTNTTATAAATNLGKANTALQKSLARLSSGSKIASPADDAGGLAVSMKLTAAKNRSDATNNNVQNAISFLQTQDGGLDQIGKIVDRMSQLKTMSTDVTKSAADVANYNTEFTALQAQITSISNGKFNGAALFDNTSTSNAAATTASTLVVSLSEDGSTTMKLTPTAIGAETTLAKLTNSSNNLSNLGVSDFTDALQTVASSRAQNGADASRLQFSSDLLTVNANNLEAANSRIADVDVAQESTALARHNVLVQAGTSMLAQANSSAQSVLKLLQ